MPRASGMLRARSARIARFAAVFCAMVFVCIASAAPCAWSSGDLGWFAQNSGKTTPLAAVTFTDASHGWAVGWGGVILATSNGGSTWTEQASGITSEIHGVSFTDVLHGWVVAEDGQILRTTNGGGMPPGLGASAGASVSS